MTSSRDLHPPVTQGLSAPSAAVCPEDEGSAQVREARSRAPEEEVRLLRELVEQVPDGVCVWTGEARLILCNTAAMRLFGMTEARARRGMPVEDVMPKAPAAQARVRIHECARTRMPLAPIEYRHEDGRVIEARAVPFDFDGEPAVISLSRDVTERRQLEARMMMTDRMASVGVLASGVAHELNNPLAWVLSNLRFLEEELTKGEVPGPAVLEALEDAAEGARRMAAIVRDLQTFSRADDSVQEVGLAEVTEAALQIAGCELRRRARVVTRFGPAPKVMGNAAKLGQALLNVLINAGHAIPAGDPEAQRIEIGVGTGEDGWAEWTVKDSGTGMDDGVRSRIFEPFFTTRDVGVGTGLGLAVCHALVTRMGGTISCESEPGRGTLFTLRFPPASQALVPPRV